MPSPPLKGITHLYDNTKKSEAVWDDTYFPVLTVATNGLPVMDLMAQFYHHRDQCLEYAKQNGIRTVLMSDLSHMKTPDAVERRKLSELAAEKDAPFIGSHLGTVFIVTNPLVRGIITAVSWVVGESVVPASYAPNVARAAKEIGRLYTAAGLGTPEFPEDYSYEPFTL
jgi:hypothetical protein